ncbi:MAG: hypothetical protein RMJ39_09770, partial [Deltaproteobacteria bacterium]|nr:hypothetical protein [Deltaproteobacteria bacterium]
KAMRPPVFYNSFRLTIIGAGLSLILGGPYIKGLFTVPIASNNIYEQQYQMHRFVVEYYKKPVAVNDLGYVSYKNPYYVLDLAGLGSKKAFYYRKKELHSEWLEIIIKDYNVGLAMIYDVWFKEIPMNWIKIGTLTLSRHKITPACREVSFYATNLNEYYEINEKLKSFITTLPRGVTFSWGTR